MEANSPSQASSAEIRSKNNKTTLSNKLLLESAWTRHDVYSDNAKAAQNRFLKVRRWIISLNVVAVFLAVFHAELGKKSIILEPKALRQFPMTSEQALEIRAQ